MNQISSNSTEDILYGPYKLVNNKTKHAVTLCIMENDLSISKRNYNKEVFAKHEKIVNKAKTEEAAIELLQKIMSEYIDVQSYKDLTLPREPEE